MCPCFGWFGSSNPSDSDDEEGDGSSRLPQHLHHLEGLDADEIRFTANYPSSSQLANKVLSPKSASALIAKLDAENTAALASKVLLAKRTRYKCMKQGRHGSRKVRYFEIVLNQTTGDPIDFVLYRKRGGVEANNDDDIRICKLSNLRPRLLNSGRELVIEFIDHSTSPLIVSRIGEGGEKVLLDEAESKAPSPAAVDESDPLFRSTSYLEDLMNLLSQGFYRRKDPTERLPGEELIDDLEVTINDALFISMQNYSEGFSSDGTPWTECYHGLDGTRVYQSASFNPAVPRFKGVTHIRSRPEQCWEAFTNWSIRPGWDDMLFRANILQDVDLPNSRHKGARLQLIYYSTNKRAHGPCAGREFIEVRVLLPPDHPTDTGKIITHQIREDKVESYKAFVHSRDNKDLLARHHEAAVFFKPFKNGEMTHVTFVTKIELQGSILAGTFSSMSYATMGNHVAKIASDLKVGLETENKLYLPDWESKNVEEEIVVNKMAPPVLKRALTLSNSIMGFDAMVIKGPPGIGFGLVIEDASSLVVVKHVIASSLRYGNLTVKGKNIQRSNDIREGDVIVAVEDTPIKAIGEVVSVMKRCKIGEGVKLSVERLKH
mmetsp:Transcript_26523/g.55301  ORF Transcript_26523/g.55301 Transcript_26523/m.55301 type:complete len:604 (+) Transcript_26523:210-2021(+)|eukprot:CAMPEP_0197553234 /NCGR_PEP_ID=MMETSP1320-20131121/8513_1 /TAXON_ID=91990 /ORGANISM="Bolidomonas sp., Strain RCC2347" /LENGTH=603 /DNA_ID=CAMNT_0043113965 /DNA_START=112 /DNA_END=1923 /DNA_ORIENTATION=-